MKIVIKPGRYWVFGKPKTLFEKDLLDDIVLMNYAKNIIEGHRRRGFEIKVSQEELKERIKEVLNTPCVYCGAEMKYYAGEDALIKKDRISADVINPQIKELSMDNLQFICTSCNTIKGNFTEEEFFKRCELITLRHTYQREQMKEEKHMIGVN